jgi:hypothetical protein
MLVKFLRIVQARNCADRFSRGQIKMIFNDPDFNNSERTPEYIIWLRLVHTAIKNINTGTMFAKFD